ncbi:hypothetical protein C8Q77DRAFT_301467 [Trametes polyzona]|nr:hypothetical protein C8Q77DRAFT_301467 [Trametes polyzona]
MHMSDSASSFRRESARLPSWATYRRDRSRARSLAIHRPTMQRRRPPSPNGPTRRSFPDNPRRRASSSFRLLCMTRSSSSLIGPHMVELQGAWPDLLDFEVATWTHRRLRRPSSSHSRSDYGTALTTPIQVRDDHPTVKTIANFAHAHPHLMRFVLPSIDQDARPDLSSVPFLDHGLRRLGVCALNDNVGLLKCARALNKLLPHFDVTAFEDAVARSTPQGRQQGRPGRRAAAAPRGATGRAEGQRGAGERGSRRAFRDPALPHQASPGARVRRASLSPRTRCRKGAHSFIVSYKGRWD